MATRPQPASAASALTRIEVALVEREREDGARHVLTRLRKQTRTPDGALTPTR
ncbi:hypothetical protein [Actinomadura geliboluensis]|uniref:hypothetical protein n=1 Tax=Actinomadura geliboluensis TaxID=882440 RepID=UPI0036A82655